ncbi:MAG TPA: DUF2784 domain-containing protein [Gammaproteobacteria bacterium]|nr:DUF2784 domain-containing protein [Gammaproteobacteria bacterium]
MEINVYRLLADAVVCLHMAFVLFAVFGGLLAFWRRAWLWLHIPAVVWAAFVEFSGWICPLTPLEHWLRSQAGEDAYSADFIEHYLIPLLYPAHLTRGLQIALGGGVLAINAAVYARLVQRRRRGKHS